MMKKFFAGLLAGFAGLVAAATISVWQPGGDLSTSTTWNNQIIANLAVTNAKIANATIDLVTKVTGTLPVANGGSGAPTLTGYLSGNGTSPFTASATIPGTDITGAALTRVDDTNVTLTLGGTPATSLLRATSITAGWTGQLAATRGGTGQSAVTTGDLLYGSAANTWSRLPDIATGNALLSGGVGVAPSWGKIGLTTTVTGTLPVANGGTNLTGALDDNVMVGNGTTWISTAVPNCVTGSNNVLNYATATNLFSCGTAPGGFTGLANPTGTIGLTAVNGSATTAMRSDGAPALSQAITPVWTGAHFFTGVNTTSVATTGSAVGLLGAGFPGYTWIAAGAPANARRWDAYVDQSAGSWALAASTDGGTVTSFPIVVSRSGTTVTNINLAATTVQVNGQPITWGTWTPTLTNTANISSSSPLGGQYLRVGGAVTVSLAVSVTPTVINTNTVLGISLPVASNFSAFTQASGTCTSDTTVTNIGITAIIDADATNDRLTLVYNAPTVSAAGFRCSVTYQVLP